MNILTIGRNGQFTPLQNVLTKAKDSVMSDLMPIFRLPLEGLGNLFKKRSDKNDRVREEMLRDGRTNTPPSQSNNPLESTSQENGIVPVSSSQLESGHANMFNGQQIANVFNGPTTNIFNGNFSNVTPQANAYNTSSGTIETKEQNFIDTTFSDNDGGTKDFNTLEDEESYRRDSINEQRNTTKAIENLSAILAGSKGGSTSSSGDSSGGSILDSMKNYLLTNLGINKSKQIIGGLKDKVGDIFKKKSGGLLSRIPGGKKAGALLAGLGFGGLATSTSGDGSSMVDTVDTLTDVADVATDNSKPKPTTPNTKPNKPSLAQRFKDAFKFVKESKAGKAVGDFGSKSSSFVKEPSGNNAFSNWL